MNYKSILKINVLAQRLQHCRQVRNYRESNMARATILDWTDAQVLMKRDQHRDVKYTVYRDGKKNFLEIRGADEKHIHTLELPVGMR